MTFLDLLRVSGTSLLKHKLRSGLTLLGIVIGILSVAAITTVVQGIDRYVANVLGTIGSQGFIITRIGIPASEEAYLEALKRKNILASYYEEIKRECPSVTHAAPFVRTVASVKSGRLSAERVSVEGTTEDAQFMSEIGLSAGRYFTPYEVRHARDVCILGADVAEKIFATADLIDKPIYIKGHRFRVIGANARMGSVFGESRDSFVRIPVTTLEKIFGRGLPADISVRTGSPGAVDQAIQEVRGVLRRLRRLDAGEEDDFGILTSEALMRMWRTISANAFLASIGIGSIALLVGGIGIMNIMFVSVKERTVEIGVRKAVGATRRSIMLQFLTESSLLCLVGGGIGVGLGIGAAMLLSWQMGLPVAVEWWAVALALAISVGVGVFFGVYPAVRAASLQPVSSLRYEQ
jgi:putative ABC transport system permease protein